MKDVAILITTCMRNYQHARYMYKCVESCAKVYPTADIYVLDDSPDPSHSYYPPPAIPIRVKHARCGEVNAYVWACEHREGYRTFLFVHDSTFQLSPIPIQSIHVPIAPLWYVGRSDLKGADCSGAAHEAIVAAFRIPDKEGFVARYKALRDHHDGEVIFGGMAVFTSEFCKELVEKTNFLEIASAFNTRPLRSFFERFLYLMARQLGQLEDVRAAALCGDIFNHVAPFRNKTIVAANARNPYILKIWQGR